MEKLDTITEDSITMLVDHFYTRVRKDSQLGPIFRQAIGEEDRDWVPHLLKICDFWSSIMLHTGRFHGNPMRAHKDLPSFDLKLFDRWLALFTETAREIHTDDIAASYEKRAHRIAASLRAALYDPSNPFATHSA